MNEEFQQRLRRGDSPFDGVTLRRSSEDLIPLSILRPAFASVVEYLHAQFGADSLRQFWDWSQHDGFVTRTEPAAWADLLGLRVSDDVLMGAFDGETHVRRAYFPEGCEFLLRVYVSGETDIRNPSPGGPEYVGGDWDVTGDVDLIERLRAQIKDPAFQVLDAKPYFDRIVC